jgi:PAS domain S-box-containing protein
MVAITVHNGREILYANDAAVELYRASSVEDLLGRDPIELVHPDERESVRSRHARVAGNKRTPTIEQRRVRFDGVTITVECAGSPIIWAGESCILSEVRDVTERKRAEEAVFRAKEEAEFASRSKSEFLANMSHELRTPLNAIIGFSEIMHHEMLGSLGNPRYHEYSCDIHQSGIHLLDVINDILDLSKIEAGKLELNDETFDPETMIENSLRLVKERAKSRNVEMSLGIAKRLPRLRGDQRKVMQVLTNLLSNAVKFTPSGGAVTIEMDVNPAQELRISVVDTGIGIAPEDIDKALTPFGQVDSALSRKFEGTGLGLPLAKSLVELHGGVLDLESVVGSGTRVTVRFPSERLVA